MRRTPALTSALWTAVGLAPISCGEVSSTIVDARIVDSLTIDGAASPLSYPTVLNMTAECGGAATGDALQIGNSGDSAVTITAIDVTGGFTVDLSLPVAIAAGQMLRLPVSPPAAVIGTDLPGAIVTGTLTLTADRGGPPPPVELKSTIVGAHVFLSDAGGNPITSLAIDSAVPFECPLATVSLRNSGTAAATVVGISGSSSFIVGSLSGSDLPPGGELTHSLGAQSFGNCTGVDVLVYSLGANNCAASTINLDVTFNLAGGSCFCS